MIGLALQLASLGACLVIVGRCEPVLNRMGRHTPLIAFSAFFLLAIGAAIQTVAIALGEQPTVSVTIITVGIAALLVCERRLRVFFRGQRKRVES